MFSEGLRQIAKSYAKIFRERGVEVEEDPAIPALNITARVTGNIIEVGIQYHRSLETATEFSEEIAEKINAKKTEFMGNVLSMIVSNISQFKIIGEDEKIGWF